MIETFQNWLETRITSWSTIGKNKCPSRYIAVKFQNQKTEVFKGTREPSRIHKSKKSSNEWAQQGILPKKIENILYTQIHKYSQQHHLKYLTSRNNPNCPSVYEWINEMLYILHTTEYYSAIKRNEILTNTSTWMNLENMLSERSQAQGHMIYDSIYLKYPE